MQFKNLFTGDIRKNIINVSSAEFALTLVNIKLTDTYFHLSVKSV